MPTAVGGNSWGLAQGERRLGLDARVLVRQPARAAYPYDYSLGWERRGFLAKRIKAFHTFLKIRREYDVYHFNFGTSLCDFPRLGLPLLEVPFYPPGKKIVFTYNGCDARQRHETVERFKISACREDDCYAGACQKANSDAMRARSVAKASRHAIKIFALNPDLLRFLPPDASFLPYTVAAWTQIEANKYYVGRKITIVHLPSNRGAKGSKYIVDALENLCRARGNSLSFHLVEQVTNRAALEAISRADLVIDQVLVGWYGALAVEAMKMGKPVAAYIRSDDLAFLPREMAEEVTEAIINIDPYNIEQVLAGYLDDPSQLVHKSQAALDYVHKWHDPVRVARLTKAAYEA